MFPSGAKPKMLRILAGMDKKDRCSGIYKAGIDGDNAVLFPGRQAPGCSSSWPIWTRRTVRFVRSCVNPGSGMCTAGFTGYAAPRAVFLRCRQAQMLGILAGMEQIDSYAAGWFCLSRCTSRCIPSCCPQAPDACHHGRYGPEGMLRVAMPKTAEFRSDSSSQVVDISFCGAEVDSHGLAVQ